MTRRVIALGTPRIHHDALDWVRRVVANGGSCSQSTLRAVSAFCDAIDRAGIRDRFYRLNLFAGNSDASLNAVRTPLFRNWSAYAGRNLLSSGDNLTLSTWTKSGTTTAISSSERPFTYGPFASVVTAVAGTGVTPHVVNSANNYGYGTVTVSAYLKANGQNTVRILPAGSSGMTFPGGGAVAFATINLSDGAISNVLSGTTATATSVGNGWYRLAYTFTNNGVGNMGIRFDVGGGSPYNATGSESFFIWGIQSELGSSASAYEPLPLGNTTETNVNFVAGDYAETGANGGLTGTGTVGGKILRTGLTPAALPVIATGHLSAYAMSGFGGTAIFALLGTLNGGFANNFFIELNRNGAGNMHGAWGGGSFSPSLVTSAQGAGIGHVLVSRTSATALSGYRNTTGSALNTQTTSVTPATATNEWLVFAHNDHGGPTPLNVANARMGGYSIGAGMTGSQAAAFYAAMQAFQTALGRQV